MIHSQLSPPHRLAIDRFVAACQADDRVVAAVLGGSYASGQADAFSDLDLAVITTDATFDDFFSAREGFMRVLGEPLFLESFDSPITLFAIFDDGTELELSIGRESQFDGILIGPYAVLVDKRGILSGAVFTGTRPTEAEQIEHCVDWCTGSGTTSRTASRPSAAASCGGRWDSSSCCGACASSWLACRWILQRRRAATTK